MPEKVTGWGKWWGCSLHSPKDPLSFRANYASCLLPNLSFRLSSISLGHKAGQVETLLLPPTHLSHLAKACTPTLCPASVSLRWDQGVWRPRLPEQGQGRTPLSGTRAIAIAAVAGRFLSRASSEPAPARPAPE